MDRQSKAFREATEEDHWDGTLTNLPAEAIHMPVRDPNKVYPREYFEESIKRDGYIGWDAERTRPKTQTEAQAALEERIFDPSAPDDESEILSYSYPDPEGSRFPGDW